MKAPSLWVQLLIALLAIGSLPTVISLLAKIHLLPLAVSLLMAYGAPTWAAEHQKILTIMLIISILYPLFVWGSKLYGWWKEEQYLRGKLLASATPFYSIEDIQDRRCDECSW